MDEATAKKLIALTSDFYRIHATSFSETRTHAWAGWEKVFDVCAPNTVDEKPARVLDMACGNMRFARFLEQKMDCAEKDSSFIDYYAIDNCPALAKSDHENETDNPNRIAEHIHVHFQDLDILETLANKTLYEAIDAPSCDLSVCFGFMHHIPLKPWRIQLLDTLVSQTHPGGYIAVSFWQFLQNEKLRRKADKATLRGCAEWGICFTDPNDRLLGWQDSTKTYRYCHSFDESELNELVAAVSQRTREVVRYNADNSNAYLILQRTV